jgi:AraC family transcriptional regulator
MLEEMRLTPPSALGVATYPAGTTYGPRLLRDFEFVWVIEGDVEYRRDGESFPAPPGSIVLCRPEATDFFRWGVRGRTRHGYFHFDVLSLPEGWPPLESWPLVRRPVDGDVLRPLFRHLLAWAGRGDSYLCELTMAHMLTAFVNGEVSSSGVPREALPEPVERAQGHVFERLEGDPTSEIGLPELARVACVSPEHLCRLFRASTGRSPMETVRLARLDRAAALLARSNYPVAEVSAMCGFPSPFHFSRRFKEAFGRSPREMRDHIHSGGSIPPPNLPPRVPAVP